jgi:Phage integrase family
MLTLRSRGLWLGRKGRMGTTGIQQMLRRRSREAHLDPINPHAFRHTYAYRWLSSGGSETDLLQLAGWRSRQMLSRYGASAATEIAPKSSIKSYHVRPPGRVVAGFRHNRWLLRPLTLIGEGVPTDVRQPTSIAGTPGLGVPPVESVRPPGPVRPMHATNTTNKGIIASTFLKTHL